MSTLILHIGTEKTGTTSIQKFLKINQSRLENLSVFTSNSLSIDSDHLNHRWLTYGVMDKGKFCNDIYLKRSNLTGDDQIESEFNRRMQQLEAEIDRSKDLKGNPLWILSSEHLQSRLRQEQEIERLRDILYLHFNAIRLVVYIRRPIDLAVSLLSQQLKNGQSPSTLLECNHPYIKNLCDHASMIKKWNRSFSPESLAVRRFQHESLKKKNVIHDFFAELGLDSLDGFIAPERSNQRLSENAMKYLWHLNKIFPSHVNNQLNHKRDGLVECVLESFSGDSPFSPARSIKESYDKYYSTSEDWVLENFFPTESSLWVDQKIGAEKDCNLQFAEMPLDQGALKMIEKLWNERF